MAGGIFTSFVLELVVYPAIYEIWKWYFELKRAGAEEPAAPAEYRAASRLTPDEA
jgi:copper/silver efflux system protein